MHNNGLIQSPWSDVFALYKLQIKAVLKIDSDESSMALVVIAGAHGFRLLPGHTKDFIFIVVVSLAGMSHINHLRKKRMVALEFIYDVFGYYGERIRSGLSSWASMFEFGSACRFSITLSFLGR